MTPLDKTVANAGRRRMLHCNIPFGPGEKGMGGKTIGPRVVCFGELLLRLAAPGRERLLQTPRLEVCVGGAEANVAVSLARFGHRAAVVGTVADNALGRAAAAELRRQGVETGSLRFAPGRQGLYFLAPGAGQRAAEVLYDRVGSAFATAPPASYDWPTLLAGADWLHVSGVTPALGPEGVAATLAAMRAARAAGLQVSFDGNFRPSLWAAWDADPAAILREVFAEADLAFAGARDFALLLGVPADAGGDGDPEAAFFAAADHAFAAFPRLQRIAATLRTAGSADAHALGAVQARRGGARGAAAPLAVTGIVDRIGAGDAFAAGILHGALAGLDEDAALRFALAAAVLKHSVPGDFNLVDVAEVEALARGDAVDVRR
jgi:2-dehydro-3-deoxygluconokinase